MHESVFELVDRFAAALPQSDELTQPVDSIVRQLEARVNRLGRTARTLENIADPGARELFRSISADLKATKAELLHWQVIFARLSGQRSVTRSGTRSQRRMGSDDTDAVRERRPRGPNGRRIVQNRIRRVTSKTGHSVVHPLQQQLSLIALVMTAPQAVQTERSGLRLGPAASRFASFSVSMSSDRHCSICDFDRLM